MPLLDKINVDEQFALVVKRLGGEVLEETLPKDRDFKNADFLFRSDGIIAELKRLDVDHSADEKFSEKLSAVYRQLVADGHETMPPSTSKVTITKPESARAFLSVYQQRLQKLVKDANIQIKQTAARLGVAKPRGILLLANDNDHAFEFEIILCVLCRLITADRFRSINVVLYFTPNALANVPGYHPAAAMWAPLIAPGRQPIEDSFHDKMFAAWANRIATLTGEPVFACKVDGEKYGDLAKVKLNNSKPICLKP